jgi:hypothetical protein
MPEERSTQERQLSGDDIIAEILRNSDAGQFKIRQVALLPSVYHIYLHPSDYDTIRPVIPALTAEARAALIEKVEELNRAGRPSGFARALGFDGARPVEYKIADPDWTVEFHPDAEDKLARGDIEVYSELATASRPEFEGAMTRHVTRRLSGGTTENAPTVQVSRPAPGPAYARIRYRTPAGEQAFDVASNQIVIGRGGKTFWVDLKLDAPPDVSREHCRIRRDPASGAFFIKDTSQFGTTVDGRPIPSSIERSGGAERDANIEVQLPSRATIMLAGVVTLEFEAVQAR